VKLLEEDWTQIERFIEKEFHVEPLIHNILFLIGIQELGYGFNKLDHQTKTKVINFSSIYILNFLKDEEKKYLKDKYRNDKDGPDKIEEQLYKKGIINYFKNKGVI
jgi:hypothetical protein